MTIAGPGGKGDIEIGCLRWPVAAGDSNRHVGGGTTIENSWPLQLNRLRSVDAYNSTALSQAPAQGERESEMGKAV